MSTPENVENILEARTRRIAADVAQLVQRANTSEMRLGNLEDQGANHGRALVGIQAQLSDIAASLRTIARRLDVHEAE